jgi:hypothetical protein
VSALPRPPAKSAPPMPVAPPPSPEAIARSIAGLAARLSELMVKETALLVSGRTREVAALTQEKTDLARAYAGRWAQLKASKTLTIELPDQLRDALRVQVSRLMVVAEENEKALRLMQSATDRVLGIITKAIRQQHTAGMGYMRNKKPPSRTRGLLGVALDRRF